MKGLKGDVEFLYVLTIDNESVGMGTTKIEFVTDVRLRGNELFVRGYDMDGNDFSNFYEVKPWTRIEMECDE